MADNLQKRPSKGILKNSSSFDTQDNTTQTNRKSKETKWDEMNIIATLHPADKDYGHMKIDEPKTPYNYAVPEDKDALDASELAERIRKGASKPPKIMAASSDESEDESDDDLTPEEKAKRRDFEKKRKQHYNEYYAVKLARKLLEEEDEDEDDEDGDDATVAADRQHSTPSPPHDTPDGESPSSKPDRDKNPQCSKYCTQNK